MFNTHNSPVRKLPCNERPYLGRNQHIGHSTLGTLTLSKSSVLGKLHLDSVRQFNLILGKTCPALHLHLFNLIVRESL